MLEQRAAAVPILGITGTGGSGKSSLTDELVLRLRLDFGDTLRIAVIAVDPTRRKTGGALLGDRIRMNALDERRVYMRSLATRHSDGELPAVLGEILAAVRLAGFDVIIVETPGIGQGDAGIVPYVDSALYVMTPEFGAASQLEKIDMLDFADVVAINKFDRKGADDALRDVRKQLQRNRGSFDVPLEDMPVYGTIAARFNDDGVTALYQAIRRALIERGLCDTTPRLEPAGTRTSTVRDALVPLARQRYLAEIAARVRRYRTHAEQQAGVARERQHLTEARRMLADAGEAGSQLDALIDERGSARRALTSTARAVARAAATLRGRRARHKRARPRAAISTHLDHAFRNPLAASVRAPISRRRGPPALAALGERSWKFPVHGGRVCTQAPRRGADAHVRRRRRCRPHQSALQASVGARQRQTAVDGVRLGDVVRLGSRRAARHLRKGR